MQHPMNTNPFNNLKMSLPLQKASHHPLHSLITGIDYIALLQLLKRLFQLSLVKMHLKNNIFNQRLNV